MFSAILGFTIAPTTPDHDLDFWLGRWDLEIKSRDADSSPWQIEKGHNRVERTLDGKVIQESFETKAWVGRSWSVYTPATKMWRQTWVDNNGAYIVLAGGKVGEQFVLVTPERSGRYNRMVFRDISDKGFTWDWDLTTDGGKTFVTRMRIDYKRAK